MKVLLLQLDGKLPNIALMRISTHHKEKGDEVVFRYAGNPPAIQPHLGDNFEKVYASLIFSRSRALAEELKTIYPRCIIGGTGWDLAHTVENEGITTLDQDYSFYPGFRHSIGFSSRGCSFRCPFCLVWRKEPVLRNELSITEIWRGEPYAKEIQLLDNDFFGVPGWEQKIQEMNRGNFKICLNQGINIRTLTDEAAGALAGIQYYDDQFKSRRIYCSWDNRGDEKTVFAGLELLKKHGVNPDHIMVYILVGYWKDETWEDREYRRARLREFGCRPYPMVYLRTRELVGFQRFVVGAYDKRISWPQWVGAGYRPERLGVAGWIDGGRFESK